MKTVQVFFLCITIMFMFCIIPIGMQLNYMNKQEMTKMGYVETPVIEQRPITDYIWVKEINNKQ